MAYPVRTLKNFQNLDNARLGQLKRCIDSYDFESLQEKLADCFESEDCLEDCLNDALMHCASVYNVEQEGELFESIISLVGAGADIDYQDNVGDTLLIKLVGKKDSSLSSLEQFVFTFEPSLKLSNKKGEYPARIIYRSNRPNRKHLLEALAA